MSEKHRQFPDWTSVRDALESAYKELGLKMEQPSPNHSQYNTTHWNLAGLIRDYVLKHEQTVPCWECKKRLTVHSVIRCLDCRMALCEHCAPAHFGPKHSARAAQAHS